MITSAAADSVRERITKTLTPLAAFALASNACHEEVSAGMSDN